MASWDDYVFGIPTAGGYNLAKAGYNRLKGPALGPDPSQVGYQHQGQIEGAVQQGMGQAAPQLNSSLENQLRQRQMQQIGQLQGIASGQQQGAGELAVQRQVANALAAQQANARMARGPMAGLAMRNAAGQSAALGLSGAGMSQQAGLQDQMAAQNLLGQVMGQARGQDIGVAGQNAQLQAGQNQLALQYLSQLTGMDIAQLQAAMQGYATRSQDKGLLGPLLSAGGQVGAAAAMSDERVKKDISDGGDGIDEMLDHLVAKRYSYKDPKHGVGPRIGIMAQDMEKSRAGRDVVRELPEGKALDINAALSAALAATARLNQRLRKVEKAA